jgi:hypothetical protein
LVGKDARLGEAIHAFANIDVHPPIGSDDVMEVVGNNDFVWDDVEAKAHVLWIGHGRVKIKVSQVNANKNGTGCAYG